MPERLECEVLQKVRYINTLTFYLPLLNWITLRRQLILILYFYWNLAINVHEGSANFLTALLVVLVRRLSDYVYRPIFTINQDVCSFYSLLV